MRMLQAGESGQNVVSINHHDPQSYTLKRGWGGRDAVLQIVETRKP